ncbi:MAG: sigma-54-dependent Fis family transcriptional regulator [Deltaproteobacteria bacterium]|nr:MAG: sigma-54-dependent Fis family transcriptional regulator [Deltaproteobacteria bacterium]
MVAATALVVEDDSQVRQLFREVCRSCDLDVQEASRGDEGLHLVKQRDYSLMLSDYMMPGMNGLELIQHARRYKPQMPIVLVTGYATTDRIVDAMQAGANLVLEKPVELPRLARTIKQLVGGGQPEPAPAPRRQGNRTDMPLGGRLVSHFKGQMGQLAELIDKVARTDCTVLIRGESGTGKELVARAIHEMSARAGGPFVPVNCGAIPENLLESELFGHTKGAFSGAHRDKPGRFALADGGTIFLDEIGEMSPAFQVKLLRVLQEKCFEPVGSTRTHFSDFRVIAATHRDLFSMVEEGTFREDLYYRLNVVELNVPPLRQRTEDIGLLIEHFVARFNERHGLDVTIDDKVLEVLRRYRWPGNVRELENLVERACILRQKGRLSPKDLPPRVFARGGSSLQSAPVDGMVLPEEGIDFYAAVEQFENNLLRQALERCNGNKNRAAALLSMNRTTLVEKLKKKGML